MIYRVSNIEWDTDGEDPTALDLPPSVTVECDDAFSGGGHFVTVRATNEGPGSE